MTNFIKKLFSKKHFEVTIQSIPDWRMAHFYRGKIHARKKFTSYEAAHKWGVEVSKQYANAYANTSARLEGFQWTINPLTEEAKALVSNQ